MSPAEAMEVDEQSTDNAEETPLPPISFGSKFVIGFGE